MMPDQVINKEPELQERLEIDGMINSSTGN